MPSTPLADWADRVAFDIFIAEGGVDDFDTMTEAEVRTVVYRELPNFLAETVVSMAISLQGTLP